MLRESISARGSSRRCLLTLSLFLLCSSAFAQDFETKFFKITINNKGYITSMKNNLPGSASYNIEFSPPDKPSPVLCLYASKTKIYYMPQSATYVKPDLTITYSNGIVATVEIKDDVTSDSYIRFKLKSLSERKDVDDIQWGMIHTSITNILGEVLGVAKDTSDAVNYAIGMFSCNDNTSAAPSKVVSDLTNLSTQMHSPHPKYPVKDGHREGQRYIVGGSCDVCFYKGIKEYIKMMAGTAGEMDENGRISFAYHSPDRRKTRTAKLPYHDFETEVPGPFNYYEIEPVPTEDCVGSTVALYGAPEDITITEVLEKIVINEGLMRLMTTGNSSKVPKWMRDPARTMPAASGGKDCDFYKVIDYADKMGFAQIYIGVGYHVNWRNNGNIVGYLNTYDGKKPYREVCNRANAKGISMGVGTVTNVVRFTTSKDVRPIPNEHLCCQFKRKLLKGICSTVKEVEVDNPLYFDLIGSYTDNGPGIDYIKIGTELIKYQGISKNAPFVLQNIERGALGTQAQAHPAGAEICRLVSTIPGIPYDGFVPDLTLLKTYGEYYAMLGVNTGLRYFDNDAQEFLHSSGHGQYAFKVFYKAMQQKAVDNGFMVRSSASSFTEGSWLYQTVANYGAGGNVFNTDSRELRPQGIAMNNSALGSFFPSSFSGSIGGISESSTVQFFENLEAMSVGMNASYTMDLNPDDVEKCRVREEIFKAVKTWECARAANAFSRKALQKLRIPKRSWHLKEINKDTWELYNANGSLFEKLTRATGY